MNITLKQIEAFYWTVQLRSLTRAAERLSASQPAMSYCQIWCMPMKSSGDLAGLFDLFSVNKFHAFNNLCQVFEAA